VLYKNFTNQEPQNRPSKEGDDRGDDATNNADFFGKPRALIFQGAHRSRHNDKCLPYFEPEE
jgi:hypothetical protein